MLRVANSIVHYLRAPPFAPFRARQIDRVALRALMYEYAVVLEHRINTPERLNVLTFNIRL